jgi:hypothetical protein
LSVPVSGFAEETGPADPIIQVGVGEQPLISVRSCRGTGRGAGPAAARLPEGVSMTMVAWLPRRTGPLAAGVALLALAGCTMCPDPYDYSGPVPNGSVTQNDFRARSNGIAPIAAAPRPWPPIVRRKAKPAVAAPDASPVRLAAEPAGGESDLPLPR